MAGGGAGGDAPDAEASADDFGEFVLPELTPEMMLKMFANMQAAGI